MNRAVYASSATCEWSTPQDFFDALDAKWHFEIDVCATTENAKCVRYYTREDDALTLPWAGCCWMNPPYGKEIGQWMKKAYESAASGATVVCLVPARTDTAWWHEYAARGDVEFVRGRLKFGGAKNAAPFPSAIVVFRPGGAVNDSCAGCKHDLGGGQCKINLEAECGKGEHEMWEDKK